MALSFHKHDAMVIMAPSSRSWFLILFILSVNALPASSDDTAFAKILISFKGNLTNADQLQNWALPVDHLCINNSSNWTGIICKNGSFSGLQLENMSLGGTIDVESLSQLPILSLSLRNNNFSGPFPSDINKLASLRRLFLSNNSFSGEIPDKAFLRIKMLYQVDLAYNMFAGKIPTSLIRVPLTNLTLQNNQFEGRIPDFWQEGLMANFSNNKLDGAIPDVLSYEDANMFSGNLGLCGAPLAACPKKWYKKTVMEGFDVEAVKKGDEAVDGEAKDKNAVLNELGLARANNWEDPNQGLGPIQNVGAGAGSAEKQLGRKVIWAEKSG